MLPKKFVDRYRGKAKGIRFFGVLLEDLSKEELIACVLFSHQEKKR